MSRDPKESVNNPDELCDNSEACEECDYDSICHQNELYAEWGGKILRFD